MSTFKDILAFRGRILLFTPNASIALPMEQYAEAHHVQVISSRGWADSYGPIGIWRRVHAAREAGVFSADQVRYAGTTLPLPCTDIVWIGPRGHPVHEPLLHLRWRMTMREEDQTLDALVRRWTLDESGL